MIFLSGVLINMRFLMFFSLLYLQSIDCSLWPKGVVHYTISKKDYDVHSQDIIRSAFETLEKYLCIKFFNTPPSYNATVKDKILFISNPDKEKNCPVSRYFNYSGSVVDMVIGYKCINKKDIAQMTIEMLKASIIQAHSPEPVVNSHDLLMMFDERKNPNPRFDVLTPEDRNYINAHYYGECTALGERVPSRRVGLDPVASELSAENEAFYEKRLWPLGIVMYYVDDKLRDTEAFKRVRYAMTQIELDTCVVFHESQPCRPLCPQGVLVFVNGTGSDIPTLGMVVGEQEVNLRPLAHGSPGHAAHTLGLMLRVLGIDMMSSRFDRDNYVTVNYQNIKNEYKFMVEKASREAWVTSIPYDFESASHAPANFHCVDCRPGAAHTVKPIQDYLWQRTMTMGHKAQLSKTDKQLIDLLYGRQCKNRFMINTDM